MKKQANRKAIVISAALTMLLLTFVGGGVLMVSRIFAQPIDSQSSTPAVEPSSVSQDVAVAAPVSAAPTSTSAADAATIAADAQIIAAYQAQLEQAYNDLNDAYAQIQALQAAQAQSPAPSFFGENEHEHEQQFQRDGVIVLQPRGFGND